MPRFYTMLIFLVGLTVAGTAQAKTYKICIDPGHGGSDPGAVGCGLHEAVVNLDVSKKLKALMDGDTDLVPILTRSSNVDVSLSGRVAFANDNGADRFASIHCNAFNGSATGIETYCYTYGSSASIDQRDRIQVKMTETWPELTDRGSKTAGFYVIKNSSMPATLSELAFIDNCSLDATYLSSNSQLQAAAGAHYLAIRESLGLSGGDVNPPVEDNGKLLGTVYEDQGVGPADMSVRLPGAKVNVVGQNGSSQSTTAANEDAMWAFNMAPGTYTVTVNLDGYWNNTRVCSVAAGQETWCSIGLTEKEDTEPPQPDTGVLLGVIYEDTGVGDQDLSIRLAGAVVSISGDNGYSDIGQAIPPDAMWEFVVAPGTYTVSATHPGYFPNERVCVVTTGQETWCSLGLLVDEDDPGPGIDTGKLVGMVYEDPEGGSDLIVPLPGATITLDGPGGFKMAEVAQAPNAYWEFDLDPGPYTVTAIRVGYYTESRQCQVKSNEQAWCSVGLSPTTGPPPKDGHDIYSPSDDPDATGDMGDEDETGSPLITPGDSTGKGKGGCSAQARDRTGLPGAAMLLLLLLTVLVVARSRRVGAVVSLVVLALTVGCADARHQPPEESATAALELLDGLAVPPDVPLRARRLHRTRQVDKVRPLTLQKDYVQPVWAPNGRRLAFAGERLDTLFAMAIDDDGPRFIAEGPRVGYAPVWSKSEACLGYRHPNQRMSDVPAMGRCLDEDRVWVPKHMSPGLWVTIDNHEVVLHGPGTQATISPGGQSFCCAQIAGNGRWISYLGISSGIYVHDVDSSRTWYLGRGTSLSFSLDGASATFEQCRDDGQNLIGCQVNLVNLSGPRPVVQLLAGLPDKARYPALAPDGKTLAFAVDGAIWLAEMPPRD
jgi:N-acetylmuramoyl-L-alanine amidase